MSRVNISDLSNKVSSTNHFLHTYFDTMYDRTVSVPAAVISTMFQLDFKVQLELISPTIQHESEEKINQYIRIIASTYESLNTDETVSALLKMGLKPERRPKFDIKDKKDKRTGPVTDEEARILLTDFVVDMKTRFTRTTVESGFQGLMIRNILHERASASGLSTLKGLNIIYVSRVVDTASGMFGQLTKSETGADLALWMSDQFSKSPLLGTLRNLYSVLRNETGAVVPVRESYVVDEMFKTFFDTPFMSKESILEAKAYKVTGCIMKDLSFADAIAGFMWSFNTILGIKMKDDKVRTVSIEELVPYIVTGVGETLPYVPEEAGVANYDRMYDEYMKVYFLHVVLRFLRDEPGEFKSRIDNTIQKSKFFKLEELARDFTINLYSLSVAYEAFRDTAAYFRELYKRTDVLFADHEMILPSDRLKVINFMEDHMSRINAFSVNMDHPAYFKQPAHILGHVNGLISMEVKNVEYTLPRRIYSKAERIFTLSGVNTSQSMKLFTAGITQGSWFDITDEALPMSRDLLNRAVLFNPTYSFKKDIETPIMLTKTVKYFYNLVPESKLDKLQQEDPDLHETIVRMSQRVRYFSEEELSQLMGIPMTLAQAIWAQGDGKPGYFLDLSESTGVAFFFESDLFGYYEVKDHKTERFVRPFISKLPALDIVQFESIQFSAGGGIFKDTVVKDKTGQVGTSGGGGGQPKPEESEADKQKKEADEMSKRNMEDEAAAEAKKKKDEEEGDKDKDKYKKE